MIKHSPVGRESPQDSRDSLLSLPASTPGLEEAAAAQPGSWAAAAGFALSRLAQVAAGDARPVLLAASPRWMQERGRLFGPGLARLGLPRDRWLLVAADKEAARLWAVEEALRSGAVAGALAAVETPSLVMTRRLDLSARDGRALCIALRVKPPDDLSAARVRWRVGPAPSAPNPLDAEAPGAVRWRVEAVRRRSGAPAKWLVEVEMKRVVSVWLPDWPITRRFGATRTSPPDTPFALAERTARGLVITAANRPARSIGVRIGQTHADARALCPGLASAAAEPRADADALDRLALWCERFSPSVAVDRIGPRLEGLTLDVTGAAHLFGGETALVGEIETRLRAAAVPARAAIADTPGAAWALARFGPPDAAGRVVAPGETRAALAPLPVEALRLAEPTLILLKRFGLRRVGDLYALPRAGLARRFQGAAKSGQAALQVVRRLDQALGAEAEAVAAVRPAPVYRVWRNFAEPILIVEGVEQRVPELVEALSAQLEQDGQGARRLTLTAFRVDGRTTSIEVGFSTPARAPRHLARVLRDAGLDHLDLGFGADALMLAAPAAEPIVAGQSSMEQEDARGDLPALVDRLQAKLGPAAVRRPAARDSWLPERSETLARADAQIAPFAPCNRLRPLLLLHPPERAEDVVSAPPRLSAARLHLAPRPPPRRPRPGARAPLPRMVAHGPAAARHGGRAPRAQGRPRGRRAHRPPATGLPQGVQSRRLRPRPPRRDGARRPARAEDRGRSGCDPRRPNARRLPAPGRHLLRSFRRF
jgi:protein ImuB